MAPIKITSVVSCSAEDRVSSAKNLLTQDSFKKWSTDKPGQANASVILQLESEQQIAGVDIGNNGSAFVEVLVANSANDTAFENLIVMSSFMTPSESRTQTNKFKVRMFEKDELCKQTVDKKWDRVKIVCTQPYNKNMNYGLSMVTFRGVKKPPLKVSDVPLKVLDPVTKIPSPDTVKSLSIKKHEPAETKVSKEGLAASNLLSKLAQNKETNSQEALHRLKETGDKGFVRVSSSVVDIRDDDEKASSSSKTPSKTPSQKPKPMPSTSDFSTILDDVVFVLSGFKNPLRSDIREIGLSMGGQYRPDWTQDSTHLICAIANTPKFTQVKGKGIIVKKEWLFDCKKEKRRVPEKKYRMDTPVGSSSDEDDSDTEARRTSPLKRKHAKKVAYAESSDEESVPTKKRKTTDSDDEYIPSQNISSAEDNDDEDEIEEIPSSIENSQPPGEGLRAPLEISSDEESSPPRNPTSKPPLPDISDSESETEATSASVYDAETEDETEADVIERLGLPSLPDFFTGHRFFIHSDSFKDAENLRQMKRYLVAYGGKVFEHMCPKVTFIVTKSEGWLSEFKQALLVNPKIRFLKSSWVEKSSEECTAVSKTKYYIEQ